MKDLNRTENIILMFLPFTWKYLVWCSKWAKSQLDLCKPIQSFYLIIKWHVERYHSSSNEHYFHFMSVLLKRLCKRINQKFLSFQNNRNHMKIQLLIIPCDYAFNASIFNQKKQIMHSQIDRPTYFQLNNKSVDLSNLLLRMSCINKDDTEKNGN